MTKSQNKQINELIRDELLNILLHFKEIQCL
jgi:hypothetical protein